MGKAARNRQQRQGSASALPPPVGKTRPRNTRLVAIVTASLAAVIAVVVGILLATRSDTKAPAPAVAAAADRNAPPALVKAAASIGFSPRVEPGVGQVESQPASAGQPPSNPDLLPVGTRAPGFTLKTPQGEAVSLADYRGRSVLLEFFATWCPHCDAEAPHLHDLYRSFIGLEPTMAALSVNADGETAPSVYAYHSYFGLQLPALVDPSSHPGSFTQPGGPGKVSTAYRVGSYPTFYVIDGKGVITWRGDGEQPDALLIRELMRAATGG